MTTNTRVRGIILRPSFTVISKLMSCKNFKTLPMCNYYNIVICGSFVGVWIFEAGHSWYWLDTVSSFTNKKLILCFCALKCVASFLQILYPFCKYWFDKVKNFQLPSFILQVLCFLKVFNVFGILSNFQAKNCNFNKWGKNKIGSAPKELKLGYSPIICSVFSFGLSGEFLFCVLDGKVSPSCQNRK